MTRRLLAIALLAGCSTSEREPMSGVAFRIGDEGETWTDVALPAGVVSHDRSASIIWFRADWSGDPGLAQSAGVVAYGAWELYADGQRIAQQGVPGRSMGSLGPVVVALPREVTADGAARIEVRTWAERTVTWPSGPALRWLVVDESAHVALWREERRYGRLVDALPTLAVSSAALALALLHLGLHVRRPQMSGNRVFGLATAVYGVTGGLGTLLSLGVIPIFFGYQSVFLLLIALEFPLMLASLSELFGGSRRIVWAIGVAFFSRSVLMIAVPASNEYYVLHTLAVGLPSFAVVGWLVVRGWTHRMPGARVIAFSAVIFQIDPIIAIVGGSVPAGWWPAIVTLKAVASVVWLGSMAWAMWVERVIADAEELGETYRAASRFVPNEFLRRVGRANVREVQRGDAVLTRMTVMFLDIRGFTTIAESHSPEALFGLVNAILDRLQPIVTSHGGFIASNNGDGFAAMFDSPMAAVGAAAKMHHALDAAGASGALLVPVQAGIGIHTGDLRLGTIGGPDWLTVGTVGDAVNVAARLEGLTKMYGVRAIASSDTVAELPDHVAVRALDRVIVKGRRTPIGLFQIVDAERTDTVVALDAERYAQAYERYAAGRFADAAALLDAVAREDLAAQALAARCRELIARPPAAFDGIWRLDHK